MPQVKRYDIMTVSDLLNLVKKMALQTIAITQSRTLYESIQFEHYSKSKIQLAKSGYERHLQGQQHHTKDMIVKRFPKRVLLLSDSLEAPTLGNLWNYLSHFYDRIEPMQKEQFTFEDLAGIYTEHGVSRMFAVCIRYEKIDGIKVLPKGNYLCVDCTEANKESKLNELIRVANEDHHAFPSFTIQQIVVSGILHWNYQAQVFLGD